MKKIVLTQVFVFLICCMAGSANAQDAYEFKGKIGPTFEESVEDWPEEPVFTGDEPSVLLILLDDVGYAHLVYCPESSRR